MIAPSGLLQRPIEPKTPPRRWQEDALSLWVRAGRRGIASVVTGAGKTVFAEHCMAEAARHIANLHFIVLLPTNALLDQWYVSMREDLGLSPDEIATLSGGKRSSHPALVNLIVLNTARSLAPRLTRDLPATFLIVDECHRAGSPENAAALAGKHVATLGLSATPEREHDDALAKVLVPALGPMFFEYGYADARADGIIVPFDLVNVRVPLLPAEQEEYDALSRRIGRLMRELPESQDRLKRTLLRRAAASSAAKMRLPAAAMIAVRHRNARTLIFHEEIAAAERIRADLERLGLSATIYHSKIGEARRRDNLRLFRRGIFDVMVSCRALDEGVNVPESGVAIIASSTAAARQRIQRLGRVLRPAPDKERALIYTLYATDVEEQRLAREASAQSAASSTTWTRLAAQNDG